MSKEFDDYLDEIHEPIVIMGLGYLPSEVLYNVDPVAYNEHYNNWEDNQEEDEEEEEE